MPKTIHIPAPTLGLDLSRSVEDVQPGYALILDNYFCGETGIVCRPGVLEYATGLGTLLNYPTSIFAFTDSSGTEKMISLANKKWWDISTIGAASDITGSTAPSVNNYPWQAHQFNDVLIMLSGSDQPQQYDGTTISDAAFTGITDDSVLAQGCAFKERQFFVEADSQSGWYGPLYGKTGELTEIPLSSFIDYGGVLQWVQSWNNGFGNTSSNVLVFATSNGELLIFAGNYPGDTWSLIKKARVGKITGRRSFLSIPGDLLILSSTGVYALSSFFGNTSAKEQYGKINSLWKSGYSTAIPAYDVYGIYHSSKNYILISNGYTVFATSLISDNLAWSTFSFPEAASSIITAMTFYNNNVFYARSLSTIVYQFRDTTNYDELDSTIIPISLTVKTPNFHNNTPDQTKHLLSVRIHELENVSDFTGTITITPIINYSETGVVNESEVNKLSGSFDLGGEGEVFGILLECDGNEMKLGSMQLKYEESKV